MVEFAGVRIMGMKTMDGRRRGGWRDVAIAIEIGMGGGARRGDGGMRVLGAD